MATGCSTETSSQLPAEIAEIGKIGKKPQRKAAPEIPEKPPAKIPKNQKANLEIHGDPTADLKRALSMGPGSAGTMGVGRTVRPTRDKG